MKQCPYCGKTTLNGVEIRLLTKEELIAQSVEFEVCAFCEQEQEQERLEQEYYLNQEMFSIFR